LIGLSQLNLSVKPKSAPQRPVASPPSITEHKAATVRKDVKFAWPGGTSATEDKKILKKSSNSTEHASKKGSVLDSNIDF
jgi:hypothetical protein